MGRRLIGVPVAVGIRAAQLGLRAARVPLEVIGAAIGRNGGSRDRTAPAAPGAEREPKVPGTTPGAAARAEAAAPVAPPAPGAPEEAPAHVSAEPDLVAESGAVEGVSAEVEVAEPWDGYAAMRAREIEQRLSTATAEEVAVVQLYEQAHKARQSVVRAAERRMAEQAAERRRP